jgi:uncharacterized protein
MSEPNKISIGSDALERFCQQHRVRRLSLFGSYLKGTATHESDVDFLVEFEAGGEPGLIGLAQMESELSALLQGKRVDLRTPRDLSRYFRDDVLKSAQVQYDRR